MSREQLDAITRQYLEASLDEIEDRLALDWSSPLAGSARDEHTWALQEEGRRLTSQLAHADLEGFLGEAQRLLPKGDEGLQRKLARRLLEAKVQAIDAELAAWEGSPQWRPTALPQEPPEGSPKDTPRFSEVARAYGDERVTGRQWSPKTELQNRTILACIASLLGDPPIGMVTKADIRELGQMIPKLPSNLSKRFPGVDPREAIARTASDEDVPRLEPRSINKYSQLARSVFNWAHEQDLLPAENPAKVLRDVKERRARDDRLPFTDEDLKTYFRELDKTPNRPELVWIPRIMAYSGLRLNEAAQLTKADIRDHNGIMVFDVNESASGKKLKTGASRRLVPVHPHLLASGILSFAEARTHLIDRRWRFSANPIRGSVDDLSKLLNRKLRASGVTDRRKTGAHSFRHTVAARLKLASIPEYQISEILGHENESISTGRYGQTTDIAALSAALSKIELPIISLPRPPGP